MRTTNLSVVNMLTDSFIENKDGDYILNGDLSMKVYFHQLIDYM